jgi:hypothetical protein
MSASAAMMLAAMAYAQPALTEDLGELVNGAPITRAVVVDSSNVLWYKFVLPVYIPASGIIGDYLDIRTHGAGGAIVDTEIALFDAYGNLIAEDDDDGPGAGSTLSFGASCPPRPNIDPPNVAGVNHDGRDGGLAPGEYYLAVVRTAYEFSSPWNATMLSAGEAGTATVEIDFGTAPLESPNITNTSAAPFGAAENETVLLTATIAPSCSGAYITSLLVDLSSIGGPSAQVMYDDGTNGDVIPGNGVYSCMITVPSGAPIGPTTLTVTANNSFAQTSTSAIPFIVLAAPTVLTPNGAGVYTEIEDNDTKLRANVIQSITNGQVITGSTTGASTTVPGNSSADNFRIRTAPAAPGIYQHQLTLTSTGAHTGTIRGLSQNAGIINYTSDVAFQTSSATSTPARTNRWYGFGKAEEIYYRVTGTAATTSPYTAQYTVTPVTPVDAGTLVAGLITIDRAPGNSTDVDFIVYDAEFNPIPEYSNDGQNSLTRHFNPGVYYIAWSNYNTANNQPAASDDSVRSDNVLDFPDAVANSNTANIASMNLRLTDSTGEPVIVPASHQLFSVTWVRMNVQALTTPTNPNGTGSATPANVLQGNGSLLTVSVNPGLNPISTGLAVTADLSAVGGLSNQPFYDDGTHGDAEPGDNIFSFALPVATNAGSHSLPFTITDAQSRSANGSINLSVQTVTDMGWLSEGDHITTVNLAPSEVRWFRFTVPDIVAADYRYLDIATTSGPDTEIGLYNNAGNLILSDDDDGAGSLSALSFGLTNPARPLPDGVPFNGRDGSLAAGTYYLAVGTFNMSFDTANWNVTSTGPGGAVGLRITHAVDPSPHITGNPAVGYVGGSVLLTANVTSGINPPSTTLSVQGNLSAIGGSPTQTFYDDGTHGDAVAGDLVFSYLATVPHADAQAPGHFSVPVTVIDNLDRTGAGSIAVQLLPEPSGACCIAGSCSIRTAYSCMTLGGAYQGDGTTCSDIYAFTNGSGVFSSIAGTGTRLDAVSSCDNCTESVTLPFQFFFFGEPYTTAYVSSNGNVQFPSPTISAEPINHPIPSVSNPNNAIYPLWDDYNPAEQGDIYVQTFGVAPNRSFVIEWNNVTQNTGLGFLPLTSETFQVILYEGSNNIEFRYGPISPINTSGINQGAGQDASGGDATIGVENADGTIAISIPSIGFTGATKVLVYLPGDLCTPTCATSDFDGDGDAGTDADIEAFFSCLAGNCCDTCWPLGADIDADGDSGTDADIEAFFRILAGGNC